MKSTVRYIDHQTLQQNRIVQEQDLSRAPKNANTTTMHGKCNNPQGKQQTGSVAAATPQGGKDKTPKVDGHKGHVGFATTAISLKSLCNRINS